MIQCNWESCKPAFIFFCLIIVEKRKSPSKRTSVCSQGLAHKEFRHCTIQHPLSQMKSLQIPQFNPWDLLSLVSPTIHFLPPTPSILNLSHQGQSAVPRMIHTISHSAVGTLSLRTLQKYLLFRGQNFPDPGDRFQCLTLYSIVSVYTLITSLCTVVFTVVIIFIMAMKTIVHSRQMLTLQEAQY